MNKKGFTLIELLTVIVILAVIALIAVPITINIISNARENAHKRSIENYARQAEQAYTEAKLEAKSDSTKSLPNTMEELDKLIKVSGEKVKCESLIVTDDGIDLFGCMVVDSKGNQKSKHKYDYKKGKLIQVEEENNNNNNNTNNNNTNDNNGNNNSNNNSNNNKEYAIGDEITLKTEKYNVIGIGSDYVTLLKQEPLTVDEVNTYGGVNTSNNHVNMYVDYKYQKAYDWANFNHDNNHIGGMAYYSSSTCNSPNSENYYLHSISNCISEHANGYDSSDVKYVVDRWASSKFTNELKTVDGYTARLVQQEELRSQFYPHCRVSASSCEKESATPSWLYNSSYDYWSMASYSNPITVFIVKKDGNLDYSFIYDYSGAVRPVINIKKSAIN